MKEDLGSVVDRIAIRDDIERIGKHGVFHECLIQGRDSVSGVAVVEDSIGCDDFPGCIRTEEHVLAGP